MLQALTKFAPAVDEIEAAIPVRPQARFPVDWLHWPPADIALPQDNLVQEAIGVFRLRALAHLEAGQHAEAAHDLMIIFRLRDAIRPEPTLIGHLIVVTCDGLLLQPIWEGLAARRWTAEELLGIQTQLRGDDLLTDYARAIRGERALFLCRWMDGLRKAGNTRDLTTVGSFNDDDDTKKLFGGIASLFPVGWIDQNEASFSLACQELVTCVLDLKTRRVSAARVKAQQQQRAQEGVPVRAHAAPTENCHAALRIRADENHPDADRLRAGGSGLRTGAIFFEASDLSEGFGRSCCPNFSTGCPRT